MGFGGRIFIISLVLLIKVPVGHPDPDGFWWITPVIANPAAIFISERVHIHPAFMAG